MAFSIVPNPLGSVSFNGTTQSLSIPASANYSFTGDFTIEFWMYALSIPANSGPLSFFPSLNGSFVAGEWDFQLTPAGFLFQYATSTTTTSPVQASNMGALSTNTWYHVAVVRIGSASNNLKIYINGALGSAGASSGTTTIGNSAAAGRIGARAQSPAANFFNGYISNVRIVKGVGVYTGIFTPPTSPLPGTQAAGTNIAAITGIQTSLLLQTPNNASFITNLSGYAVTLTNNGTATASSLTPFAAGPAAAFTATTNPLGSLLFIGSSAQYLLSSSNAALTMSTGDFTVECWWYQSTANTDRGFISTIASGGTIGVQLAGNYAYIGTNVSGTTLAWTLPLARWNHVALVRISGTARAYLNGVLTASAANSQNLTNTLAAIGTSYTNNFTFPATGYISNVRIVKGLGVYTGNFIPPTGPLPGIQAANVNSTLSAAITGIQTSLLLQTPNNASFITDSSGYALTMTNNGAVAASSLTPFLTANSSVWQGVAFGSLSLNGTTQYLSTTGTASGTLDLAAGAGNWTVECWFYPNSVTGQQSIFWKGGATGSVNPSYAFFLNGTGGQWIVGDGGGGAAGIQNVSVTFAIGTWYHFALVRNGSTFTAYINGVGQTPVAISGTMGNTTNNALSIGSSAADGSTRFVSGYISNFRIVKGVAVYTGNFTVPIRPLTSTQTSRTNISAITGTQTSLLLNTPNTSAFITDSSSVPYTMTNNGTIVANGTTPFTLTAGPVVWATFSLPGGYPLGSLLFTTSSAVRYTSSSFAVGTGSFTAECWVWVSPSAGSTAGFLSSCSGTQSGFIIAKDVVGIFGAAGSGGVSIAPGAAITTSTWTHVALVRNAGGTMTFYVNGTSVGTPQASSTSIAGTTTALASRYSDDALYNFIGYITNSRVVSGVAVYTGNFTPPTAPLQVTQDAGTNISAITGVQTKLLNWASNNASYLSDASTNNLTGTVVGTVSSNSLTPFT